MSQLKFAVLAALLASLPATGFSQDQARKPVHTEVADKGLDFAPKELINQQLAHLSCGFRTLQRRLLHADYAFVAEAIQEQQERDAPTTQVLVRCILKGSAIAPWNVGQTLRIPAQSVDHQRNFALVYCADQGRRQLGVTELVWISETGADYFAKLSSLTGDVTRFRFLLEAETSEDAFVSDEAFGELEAIPRDKLQQVSGQTFRDVALWRLAEAELDSARRHFYLKLLGFVGNELDIELLEKYVFSTDREEQMFLGTAANAYLRLGGETAGHKLIVHFLQQPPAVVGTELQDSVHFRRLYAAYKAIREVMPALERRAKVSEFLLNNTVLADIVLENALREGDDRFVSIAMQLCHRDAVHDDLRTETVTYLAGMLAKETNASKREPLISFLESVRTNQPELYRSGMKRLKNRNQFLDPQ